VCQQAEAEWEQGAAMAVSKEAEVTDAHEAAWEKMQQETTHELIGGQSHDALVVLMSRVTPAEVNLIIVESDESAVGDGDTMSIGAEVAEHMLRPAEGWLGVDDPVMAEESAQPTGEGTWFSQRAEMSVELKLATGEGLLQRGDELAAEDPTEDLDRQEEGSVGTDPVGVVRGETAGSDNTVDVGMMLEALVPGVKNAEEADLGAEVAWITGNL
jgi:hypothetical protein